MQKTNQSKIEQTEISDSKEINSDKQSREKWYKRSKL